ncbi:hypothetical protein QCA50_004656 [Cerrena zonata]|uniref:VWFA domain-containing protein n=1 Tax=Cerrena zonata TaxID=2478898 RepID=A0AAW0GM35_9APHY
MVTVKESNESTTSSQETPRALDLVFLQDATGSQAPYINAARDGISTICEKIIQSQRIDGDKLRFGLVAFRDYEPQDYSMLAEDYGFTNDVSVIQGHLTKLRAMGGGDGPEAQAAAMGKALSMPWREDAMKVVVLITDAPPHGIGERSDYFPQGSPDGQDPLNITRQMAKRGIVLHVVACEPTLSQQYSYASEFYQALVDLTGGRMLPLLSAHKLPDYILGASIETAALENLLNIHAQNINTDLNSSSVSIEEYADSLYERLNEQGVQVDSLQGAAGYTNSEKNMKNISTWMGAMSVGEAREKIAPETSTRILRAMMSPSHPAVESSYDPLTEGPRGRDRERERERDDSLMEMPDEGPMWEPPESWSMDTRAFDDDLEDLEPSFDGPKPAGSTLRATMASMAMPSRAYQIATEETPSVAPMAIQREQVLRMVRQAHARSTIPEK